MNVEEILKKAAEEIDEILSLQKSYLAKKEQEEKSEEMEKAAPEATAEAGLSDAQEDLLHVADEHSEEEIPAEYVKKLSDEELYELLSLAADEAEARGVGVDKMDNTAAPEMEKSPDEEEQEAPEQEQPDSEQEAPEAESEQEQPESEPEQEAPEAEEQDEAPEASLEEKIQNLADSEVQALMDMLSAEMQKRQGAQKQEEPVEPAEKSTEEMPMMKSVDPRIEALHKSVTELEQAVEVVFSKRSADVTVLQKSESNGEKSPLSGVELQNWLLGQQKAGTARVNSDLVARAGLMKSEEAVESFYSELKRLGLNPPTK